MRGATTYGPLRRVGAGAPYGGLLGLPGLMVTGWASTILEPEAWLFAFGAGLSVEVAGSEATGAAAVWSTTDVRQDALGCLAGLVCDRGASVALLEPHAAIRQPPPARRVRRRRVPRITGAVVVAAALAALSVLLWLLVQWVLAHWVPRHRPPRQRDDRARRCPR